MFGHQRLSTTTSTSLTSPGALLARRWFLQQCGVGLGVAALADLLADDPSARGDTAAAAPANPLAPKAPHFPAKAKNVIFLFMAGGPSHMELFDNKPELAKRDGQLPPPELLNDTPPRLRLLYQLVVERWQGLESVSVQVRHGFAV